MSRTSMALAEPEQPTTVIPPETLRPNEGGHLKFATSQQVIDWLDVALREVTRGAGDTAFLDSVARQLHGIDRLAHIAVLIERARQAERAAVIEHLGAGGATAALLEQARAEGHAAGRAEAQAQAAEDAGQRAAAEREHQDRVREAWATVRSALGDA